MNFEEKTLSEKNVFDGKLIKVAVEEVETPKGLKAQREIVHHAPAVAILALTADHKMILENAMALCQFMIRPWKFLQERLIHVIVVMPFMLLNVN